MPVIDTQQVHAIAARYDLGADPRLEVDGAQGQSNTVVRLRTASGRYIVKWHHGYIGREQLQAECRLLDWLGHHNLPFATPRYLRDRFGSWWTEAQGDPVTVQPFLPGKTLDPDDPVQMRAAGATLGVLHQALARYEAEAGSTGGLVNRLYPVRLGETTSMKWSATDAAVGDWLLSASAGVDATMGGHARTLPVQLIHGDLVPGNLFWDGHRVSAVLDFEFAARQVRVLDLAMALLFALRYWTGQDVFGVARAFAEGYRTTGGLRADEVAAIPDLMRVQNIASAVWWIGLAHDRQVPSEDIRLRAVRAHDADHWIAQSRDALHEALAS